MATVVTVHGTFAHVRGWLHRGEIPRAAAMVASGQRVSITISRRWSMRGPGGGKSRYALRWNGENSEVARRQAGDGCWAI